VSALPAEDQIHRIFDVGLTTDERSRSPTARSSATDGREPRSALSRARIASKRRKRRSVLQALPLEPPGSVGTRQALGVRHWSDSFLRQSRRIRPSLKGVGLALLHEQWLGDLADEPVRVEQVGVGESDAVVC
jgi:hypothetical protein